ncbi:Bestrophin, RFP-TM, chloride channel-domain-containing protein [Lentinula aciculospora]|uniref:Bestrophin, RFP-TM, chloride channel-domain-containing protein n=1 Tax=Lentinula aciculospora TaxID=153920 RepID=A0A9W9ACR2_9AGAR|nr:Bestrophin, RFP-TM, chloride channel-domain-containing protein [Lentinula aciculospora]
MSLGSLNGKRAFAATRNLLPAVKPDIPFAQITQVPAHSFLAWTFGRGTVIYKIWPAVIFQTLLAVVIVTLEEKGGIKHLAIPNVMLTVLGVVLGFVLSYRAMSGYDRYWQGRTAWSDVIQHSRSLGRLVWYHVPPRLTPRTAEEISTGLMNRTSSELMRVMAEKRMALDLILGFAVALKHHLRGEVGIYYEDLYSLVRPLHEHDHTAKQKRAVISSALWPPTRARRIASNPALPQAQPSSSSVSRESSPPKKHRVHYHPEQSNTSESTYGTFPISESPRGSIHRAPSTASFQSQHQVLAPSQQREEQDMMKDVSTELIPFAGMFASIRRLFSRHKSYSELPISESSAKNPWGYDASQRKWSGPIQPRIGKEKHTVSSTSRGENLPLEILRCMSEWCSVLEERNTVPGTSLGSIIGTVASLEATLSGLEQILTTPLPLIKKVSKCYASITQTHFPSTVWIYLFFLPFQLVAEFKWHTIPGVALAAFIYLGFLAAGEEIEQPFGYDENDLDLDMFCGEIVQVDIDNLKKSPCLNAYLPPTPQTQRLVRHRSMTLTEATAREETSDSDLDY